MEMVSRLHLEMLPGANPGASHATGSQLLRRSSYSWATLGGKFRCRRHYAEFASMQNIAAHGRQLNSPLTGYDTLNAGLIEKFFSARDRRWERYQRTTG